MSLPVRRLALAMALFGSACAGSEGSDAGLDPDASTRDAGRPTDAARDVGPALPPPIGCTFLSDEHGMGPMRLDVPTDSPDRMLFTVRNVPDPFLVTAATLTFATYDADHPGEEGLVWLNDLGPWDVPADPAWNEMASTGEIDVTGATVTGDNAVVFGPGSLMPGTFFEISDVALDLMVHLEACP
jgi:hypothetical protein